MFGITEAETRGRRLSELGQHQWDVPALRHLMEKVLPENKPIEKFRDRRIIFRASAGASSI